jgi:nitrogen fixation protein
MRYSRSVVAVVLLVALSGCAATVDGTDGKKRIAGNAAAVDGAKMGTADGPSTGYTLTGSELTAGVTLDVPSGAVPAGVVVGMGVPAHATLQAARASLPSNLRLVAPGSMIEVTPRRTIFTVPVTLKVAAPDPALGPVVAAVLPNGADTWHLLPVDVSRDTATIVTDRSGIVAVYVQQLCATGACVAPDPCREAVCERNAVCSYPVNPDSTMCRKGGVCCAGKCVGIDTAPADCRPRPPQIISLAFTAGERPCRSGDETLKDYAVRCDKAMGGVTVPDFDCDDDKATDVMDRYGDTWNSVKDKCAAPNVLNGKCDPGSRFHVLHRGDGTDGIYIVAHCRKEATLANGPNSAQLPDPKGYYSDVAVIQYNSNTGATCFYQALATKGNGLWHSAPAPTSGDTSYWGTPQSTAGINCGSCHDSGPFIRSPYLAMLGQVWPFKSDFSNSFNPDKPIQPKADPNFMPGTLEADVAGVWNGALPYSFTGLNFQSWRSWSVTKKGNLCTSCHRLAYSQTNGNWNLTQGTAVEMGLVATNPEQGGAFKENQQTRKWKHGHFALGVSSPVWMVAGWNFKDDPANNASAKEMRTCAQNLMNGKFEEGCDSQLLAVGDTCPPPGFSIPGPDPAGGDNPWDHDGKQPIGSPGGKPGFYYFTELHGPFYQTSPWDPSVDSAEMINTAAPWVPPASFHGSYLRLYAEGNPPQWTLAWGVDATDIQNNNNPPPGWPFGKVEGIAFDQIDSVPNAAQCGFASFKVGDPTGSSAPLSRTIDSAQGASAAILAGFLGNVARSAKIPGTLAVKDKGGETILFQNHENGGGQVFGAQAWRNACAGWQASAHYYPNAHSVQTSTDILLVPAKDVADTICYIDGISGDWSRWGPNFTSASAKIYNDQTGWRLTVTHGPQNEGLPTTVSATCLSLKN